MPDLHPYFKDIPQAFEYAHKMREQILKAADRNGLKYHILVEVNGSKNWEKYKEDIINLLGIDDRDFLVQIINDNKPRYWIVNIDFKILDNLGQAREIGCIQIDIDNARRLGIEYLCNNGKVKNPIIVHSAIPGGIERFIYALIDNYNDNSLPLWIQPIQCRLISVSEKYNKFCKELSDKYGDLVRIDVDDRDEMVGKKIKQAKEELISNIFVFGAEEVNGKGNWSKFEEFINKAKQDQQGFPFIELVLPNSVSERI